MKALVVYGPLQLDLDQLDAPSSSHWTKFR